MIRPLTACAALVGLAIGAPLPASQKPCRDAAGNIVKCPKPKVASARCKDANGRFAPCPAPTPATQKSR